MTRLLILAAALIAAGCGKEPEPFDPCRDSGGTCFGLIVRETDGVEKMDSIQFEVSGAAKDIFVENVRGKQLPFGFPFIFSQEGEITFKLFGMAGGTMMVQGTITTIVHLGMKQLVEVTLSSASSPDLLMPPSDRDNDGVLDAEDVCPDEPQGGTPDPNRKGCPAPPTCEMPPEAAGTWLCSLEGGPPFKCSFVAENSQWGCVLRCPGHFSCTKDSVQTDGSMSLSCVTPDDSSHVVCSPQL